MNTLSKRIRTLMMILLGVIVLMNITACGSGGVDNGVSPNVQVDSSNTNGPSGPGRPPDGGIYRQ
jgi:hypothetical protein